MKKTIAFLLLCLCLLLPGCSSAPQGPSVQELQQKLDEAVAQRDTLQTQLDEALAKLEASDAETVKVTVTGTFTATVRSLIPNYVLDDKTPMMAVVTTFQSTPFILYTRDQTSALTVGKTYVFTVESAQAEIYKAEYEKGVPNPATADALYGLNVLSVKPAGEEDVGLDSVHLEFLPVE